MPPNPRQCPLCMMLTGPVHSVSHLVAWAFSVVMLASVAVFKAVISALRVTTTSAEKEQSPFADVREIVRDCKKRRRRGREQIEVARLSLLHQCIPYITAARHSSPAHQQVVKDERRPYCPDSHPPCILNHTLLPHSYSFPLTRVLSLRSN